MSTGTGIAILAVWLPAAALARVRGFNRRVSDTAFFFAVFFTAAFLVIEVARWA
jgi:hypothetical protein